MKTMWYRFLAPRENRFCLLCFRPLPDLPLIKRIPLLKPPPMCLDDRDGCQRRLRVLIGHVGLDL